ncbi:hypothetical protein SHKM778_10650 [Streptomyces sp. KM77-8]|uniref:Uncharacterized protein n=1 Tax=Streptomyces haneummycinicus TaxID=3074435 RepID=A0AAT9HBD9_9ACTN
MSTFIVGAVGALVVIAAGLYVTGTEDKKKDDAGASPSPTATAVKLPRASSAAATPAPARTPR